MKKKNKIIILITIVFIIFIIVIISFLCNNNKKYSDWVDYLKEKEFIDANVSFLNRNSQCDKQEFFDLIELLKKDNSCYENDIIRKIGGPPGGGTPTLVYEYISKNAKKSITFYQTGETEMYLDTTDQDLIEILNNQTKDTNKTEHDNFWWTLCNINNLNEQIIKIILEKKYSNKWNEYILEQDLTSIKYIHKEKSYDNGTEYIITKEELKEILNLNSNLTEIYDEPSGCSNNLDTLIINYVHATAKFELKINSCGISVTNEDKNDNPIADEYLLKLFKNNAEIKYYNDCNPENNTNKQCSSNYYNNSWKSDILKSKIK